MAQQYMLTTNDNPFNPFDDYDQWSAYDKERHYDSAERLMRIAQITDDMTSIEEDKEIERAIDEIIKYDILNIYNKVSRDITYPEE